MGQGYIVSGGGRAHYKVSIIKDPGVATERLKIINQLLNNIDILIARLETEYTQLSAVMDSVLADYAIAAVQYRAGSITLSELTTYKSKITKAETNLKTNKKQQAFQKLQKISLTKEKARLEKAIEPEVRYLWCVDYTLNIAKDKKVGILECDGDFKWMNIEEGCGCNVAVGLMQPAELSTPAGVFVNLALMPCWQRHKPYYRAGRISDINYDKNTATVTLDNPDYSSATKICGTRNTIPINFFTNDPETPAAGESIFRNVQFKYMGCNVEAFVDGDHVIIRFLENKWTKPLIIGFHDNPRPALNLIQIRFDNVESNSEIISEIDKMITDATRMKGYYNQYKTVFLPQYINALDSLVGTIKWFYSAIQG